MPPIQGKRDPAQEAEAKEWIETVIGEKFPAGKSYEDALKDGILLCKLINKLMPKAVPKINTKGGGFALMENISSFQAAAKRYGVADAELFQTVDLWERRNIPQVTLCVFSLGRHAQRYGFDGPILGPKMAEENKREFSEEQMRAGESVLGLQAGFNKGASQSGVSFGTNRHM